MRQPHPGVRLGAAAGVAGCVGAGWSWWIGSLAWTFRGDSPAFVETDSLVVRLAALWAGLVLVPFVCVVVGGLPAALVGASMGPLLWNRRVGPAFVGLVLIASVVVSSMILLVVFDLSTGDHLLSAIGFGVGGSVSSVAWFWRGRSRFVSPGS